MEEAIITDFVSSRRLLHAIAAELGKPAGVKATPAEFQAWAESKLREAASDQLAEFGGKIH